MIQLFQCLSNCLSRSYKFLWKVERDFIGEEKSLILEIKSVEKHLLSSNIIDEEDRILRIFFVQLFYYDKRYKTKSKFSISLTR